MSNPESSQPDERQVVSQPDQPSGGSTDSSTTNLDRLRQFRSEDYEAARILAIRKDLHPLWIKLLDPANAATRPALLAELNQQFKSLTGQERYWPPEWIRETLTIGGKTKKQLIGELIGEDYRINDDAEVIMNNTAFTTLKNPKAIDLVRLRVADLGLSDFSDMVITYRIDSQANQLGLERCPAEVGPHYRLKYPNQPLGERVLVWMEPIETNGYHSNVFHVAHDDNGRWLYGEYQGRHGWENFPLLFRLRSNPKPSGR